MSQKKERPLNLSKKADRFLEKLQAKQLNQIIKKINGLSDEPRPHDSKELKGFANKFRVDSGEFRVIYSFDDVKINIELIGKRNDKEVYKKFKNSK